ncbi:nuclear transport factor 2 family protein [Rhizobium leguminosarum]|jgi:ketosteroid isomerase-like protein|uniref:nuclear transport factor 2 family protein n=1 Tax=Rhizobium TaxID=379 RepID=UPI00036A211F|nr:nuclear transport factor 2 family protein [Rhizobium leguminosarum]MBY2908703.1 nuclear transport factor 2 family protein [Rhizobium leguminosarum]MBY2942729.1 nuclear transport factor 2 family protein [Rhizobium leguminosarum]MBY2963816.1 nuclear transport factor 2 family protein [Rhizobium leguminosarum]MBY2987768.1 nuclear transport factor 2 family protein [Rhizobium leguminosarum]MBY2991852.1 nuclear transport factor 2 family protein [Rhizobium leguminosarum]
MDMPGIINTYFEADRRNDADALLDTFAIEAVVEDEGAHHQGVAAIREWWVAAKKATQYRAEPVESAIDGNKAIVRARVSGQFPGSPVMLTHGFTLKDDRIVWLEIRS